jgi:hypothetical protein
MTTRAHLRRTALSLPGTAERAVAPDTAAFTVADRRFAAVGADDDVQLDLPPAETDLVLAAHPAARRMGTTGVRVPLRQIDGQQLNHWVRRAWLSRAPKQLAERAATADTAAPGEVGDLPRAIGGPATRALANAGIYTLGQVARLPEAELLALHGVGLKAVRILREALGDG